MISCNWIYQSNWKSKNNETLQDWDETGEPKLDHGKLWQDTVIDMKLEYDTKTKEELVSKLIKEIIERQSGINHNAELSNMLESLSITPVHKDSHDLSISEERKSNKDSIVINNQTECKQIERKSIETESKKIENWILRRNSYERIGKEQKLYIIECYENSKMGISKIAQRLMLGYSTVYSIIKEYLWHKEDNKEPFCSLNEKKRISKAWKKVINDFIWNQKESFYN